MRQIETVSCLGQEFYSSYFPKLSSATLDVGHKYQAPCVAEIFSECNISRPMPEETYTYNASFKGKVRDFYKSVNENYNVAPPSRLFLIERAIIWNNQIFVLMDNKATPLYETYRSIDRDEKGLCLIERLAACMKRELLTPNAEAHIFIGSAGSFNYGHWLIDDCPMLAGVDYLLKKFKSVDVLETKISDNMDRIKQEGIDIFCSDPKRVSLSLLNCDTAYEVNNLYYLTPATFHPYVKNPNAVEFLRSRTVKPGASQANKHKLFVNRNTQFYRQIENVSAVQKCLADFGFLECCPDTLTVPAQIDMFLNSGCVVGITGAAMTNTLFCRSGTTNIYLSPDGWEEPFYWDLAFASHQKFVDMYHSTTDTNRYIYRRNFTVDIAALKSTITRHCDI